MEKALDPENCGIWHFVILVVSKVVLWLANTEMCMLQRGACVRLCVGIGSDGVGSRPRRRPNLPSAATSAWGLNCTGDQSSGVCLWTRPCICLPRATWQDGVRTSAPVQHGLWRLCAQHVCMARHGGVVSRRSPPTVCDLCLLPSHFPIYTSSVCWVIFTTSYYPR